MRSLMLLIVLTVTMFGTNASAGCGPRGCSAGPVRRIGHAVNARRPHLLRRVFHKLHRCG